MAHAPLTRILRTPSTEDDGNRHEKVVYLLLFPSLFLSLFPFFLLSVSLRSPFGPSSSSARGPTKHHEFFALPAQEKMEVDTRIGYPLLSSPLLFSFIFRFPFSALSISLVPPSLSSLLLSLSLSLGVLGDLLQHLRCPCPFS